MSQNLVASVSGIPLHTELQQITRLLQSEFERHENALAEIEHQEKNRSATLPYPGRPGLVTLGGDLGALGVSSSLHRNQDLPGTPSTNAHTNSASNTPSRSVEKRRRSSSSEYNEEFGTMFLNAALTLIENDSEQRRGASLAMGGTQLSKEHAPEVVKMGLLRKGKNSFNLSSSKPPKWTAKQVVLTPGWLAYNNLKDQKKSMAQLFGGNMSAESSQSEGKRLNIKKCGVKPHHFRDGTTGHSSSNNNNSGNNDSCFIIYDRKTAGREIYIILMAQDANDRDHWISAIKTASRLPAVDARLKEDSKHCDHVREQIEQCQDKTEYLSALTSLLSPLRSNHNNHNNHITSITSSSSSNNGRVRVPMAWLRKVKNNIATIRNDMTMDQAIKDLLRDMFEIDHVLHRGNSGLVSIIGTLAGNIMDAAQHANIANFSAANALTFAREVLYNANRTQFGGDAYEAVDLICCNEGLVFATPSDQVAAPIQIQVTTNGDNGDNGDNRDRYGSDDEEEDKEDRHVYLSVVVTADMVFKINDMDPQDGDGMMVWTKVLAKFERSFVWAGDRAVALGSGAIWCSL